MTVTYGFYDSISSDRLYNAKQFGSVFDGIIEDGVYAGIGDKLIVVEDSPVSMDVIIGTGRGWFNHTWTLNDADLAKTISTADALLDRIDVVYLEVNEDSGTRANSFGVLTGTPASTPSAPALTQTASIHQYPLAHILVEAAVTSIIQDNITNKVGFTETPFVAGIIDYVTTNEIVAQWEAEWLTWFDSIKDQLSTEAETNLQAQIWDLAGVGSGAPPYADDMVILADHDHSRANHPKIDTGGLEDLAVTGSKIAIGGVSGTQLASSAVSASKLGSNAVETAKIKASAVTESKIASDAITASKIADDAINAAGMIANNLISTNHIGNYIAAIVKRFGGSSASWNSPGTGAYSTGNVRIQMGVFECAAFAQVDVTYSPAFSQTPFLMMSEVNAQEIDSQISFPFESSFAEAFRFTHFSTGVTVEMHWLAIGPE